MQSYDQYMLERTACPQARTCDFLLVNLFREPLGAPMRPLNELLTACPAALDGSDITVAAAAARAGVHRSFIHRHPDLSSRPPPKA